MAIIGKDLGTTNSCVSIMDGDKDEALAALRACEVARVGAFDIIEKLVAEPNVGKGSTNHYLVVSASGAVGVEVNSGYPPVAEVLSSWRINLDGSGR